MATKIVTAQVILLIAVLFGCKSRDSGLSSEIVNGNSILFRIGKEDLQFIQPSQLMVNQQKVATALLNGKPVSFKDLRSALIEAQIWWYNSSHEDKVNFAEVEAFLNSLLPQQFPADLHSYKIEIENNYKKLVGVDTAYNSMATNVVYIYRQKRQQCYSGTLFLLIQFLAHPQFGQMNPVIISERGHVLIGYLSWQDPRTADGKKPKTFSLIGIESTALGSAPVIYESEFAKAEFLPVDAYWVALIEIFKTSLTSVKRLIELSLDHTEQKYDLKIHRDIIGRMDEVDKEALARIKGAYGANWSPLSFGAAFVEPGDQPRTQSTNPIVHTVRRGDQMQAKLSRDNLKWLDFPGRAELLKSLPPEPEEAAKGALPEPYDVSSVNFCSEFLIEGTFKNRPDLGGCEWVEKQLLLIQVQFFVGQDEPRSYVQDDFYSLGFRLYPSYGYKVTELARYKIAGKMNAAVPGVVLGDRLSVEKGFLSFGEICSGIPPGTFKEWHHVLSEDQLKDTLASFDNYYFEKFSGSAKIVGKYLLFKDRTDREPGSPFYISEELICVKRI